MFIYFIINVLFDIFEISKRELQNIIISRTINQERNDFLKFKLHLLYFL